MGLYMDFMMKLCFIASMLTLVNKDIDSEYVVVVVVVADGVARRARPHDAGRPGVPVEARTPPQPAAGRGARDAGRAERRQPRPGLHHL